MTVEGAMERLGFRLARLGQTVNVQVNRAMTANGLGVRHNLALMHLADGPMAQLALTEALGVDPSVLVSILNCLEAEGLAVRRRDPADRRRHIVELTERGAEVVTAIGCAMAQVEAELFADLDPAETALLSELLTRVRLTPDAGACTED
jgi:DNA-binding MarR family transcriptional regulator